MRSIGNNWHEDEVEAQCPRCGTSWPEVIHVHIDDLDMGGYASLTARCPNCDGRVIVDCEYGPALA
jgi:predicted RNA-binding Zn-ribbon protein involved in translation (DUF1610 family)